MTGGAADAPWSLGLQVANVRGSVGEMVDTRLAVGVLGATGTVGATLVRMLAKHPWFHLSEVAASERTAGGSLGEALDADGGGPLPPEVADLEVKPLREGLSAPLLLSALPAGVARDVEAEARADGKLVVSNASAWRADPEVPLVVPEINPGHLEMVDAQRSRWSGGIVTNPNCVVTGLAVALAPLHRAFGLTRVVVTTLQAVSGAGRPGPSALGLVDNVIPHIPGEEPKIASEPRKILGTVTGGAVVDADFTLGATAVRVPVLHGHLASVSCSFESPPSAEHARETLASFRSDVAELALPSAPDRPLELLDADDRPQPRLDRDRGNGMTVSVGRVRPCEALDLSFLVLAHNLVRGAAGAALLNAELCRARGLI